MGVPFCALTATGLDLSSSIDTITSALGDFSISNLLVILAGALGVTTGLAITWFGYRFVKRRIVIAMTKGKI